MRTLHLAILATLSAVLVACSPFSPSLSKEPFLCGSAAPKCPNGYSCTGMNGNGEATCLENGASATDSGSGLMGMCNNDSQLMNNTFATAFVTPVDGGGTHNTAMYSGLSICPVGDTDYFKFTVTPATEAFRAVVTYSAWGTALEANVLNMAQTTVYPFADAMGSAATLKAFAANIASGTYVIEIQAPTGSTPGINNYTLEIDLCASASTAPCNM